MCSITESIIHPSTVTSLFLSLLSSFLILLSLKTLNNGFAETEAYRNGNTSSWFHCPQGWTLFQIQCFKVTEVKLTWAQAQTLCRSYGGNLVKISSHLEQAWVSQFMSEQLGSVSHTEIKSQESSNIAGVPDAEAWIGFVHLPDKTFQWSDGQAGVEQDGFWAVDGFKALNDNSISKLCCDIKTQLPNSQDHNWYLVACDELHFSVCELAACELHEKQCADGSKCVNKAWLCDGQWDCQDGSDERDCKNDLLMVATTAPQHCGSVFKGISGSFWSPNYPEEYPPFLKCQWKIEATLPLVIEIMVVTLDTEGPYDTLNIYEGTEVLEDQLIVSLGGKIYNQTIKSQGSFMTIYFTSDYSVQGKGFNITWRTELETKKCGGQLAAGDLETLLSFPQSEHGTSEWSVSKTLVCDWLISSPSNTGLVSLQFKNITLVGEDSITVYDGGASGTPVITRITSAIGAIIPSAKEDFNEAVYTNSLNIPPVITSSGHQLLLHVIISKGSLSSFVVAFKNGCDGLISSCSSLILSPGHPKSLYPNNLNCSWTVTKDRLGRNLTFIVLPHFLTETGKDYLQVFRSENEQQVTTNITKISGSNSCGHPGISSALGFVIKFVSDSTVNHGRWAAVISYECVALSVVSPLLINSTDKQFGAAVMYSCMKGFKLVGPTQTVCGWHGQWVPEEIPSCKTISCGTVPVPPGAYLVNVTGLTFGGHALYECFYGYMLVGHNAICGEHGWENMPSCELIMCPKERPPSGGNARAENTRVGYLREFFCKPNFQLVGSKFSHCNISGHWTDRVPVCEDQKCPNLYGPLNSQRTVTGPVAIGKSIHVTCDKGYKLTGQDELTCLDNLQFNHPQPLCVDIDECNNSEICGIHFCQNFIGGYSCFCVKGYQHMDNSTHICTDINECEVNNGGCSHICTNMPGSFKCDCPQNMSLYVGPLDQNGSLMLIPSKTCIAFCKPVVVEEAEVVYQPKPLSNGQLLYGTTAEIVCPSGLYPNGSSVVSCVAGIGWSSFLPNCTKLLCEAPTDIENGSVSYTNLTLGSSVSYSCDSYLILQGPRIRFCVKQQVTDLKKLIVGWTGNEPRCVYIKCPELQNPIHGRVDYSAATFRSVAVFRCQCGYQLVGKSVVVCMSDGLWSYPSPTCEAQSCLHPGISPLATRMEHTPGFPVQSYVRIQCLAKGYQSSNHDAIKCLPYKQAKVSTVRPFLDLVISGQLLPKDLASLSRDCVPNYKMDELLKSFGRMLVDLCQVLHVVVDVEKDSTSIFTKTYFNFTVHLLLFSNDASTTCWCQQKILSNFVTSLNHITLDSHVTNCPAVSLKLNATPTFNESWHCHPGLRLEEGKQACGEDILPYCMEDCLDEEVETLESDSLSATTPSAEAGDKNLSTFWINTLPTSTSTTESKEKLQEITKQPSQLQMTVTSVSSTASYTSKVVDKITSRQLLSTVTTFRPSVTTKTYSTMLNTELFSNEETITSLSMTPFEIPSQGTDLSVEYILSKETTSKSPLTTETDITTPKLESSLARESTTMTSPQVSTVQVTGSSTKFSMFTEATVKPSLTTTLPTKTSSELTRTRETTSRLMTSPNKNSAYAIVSSTKPSPTIITTEKSDLITSMASKLVKETSLTISLEKLVTESIPVTTVFSRTSTSSTLSDSITSTSEHPSVKPLVTPSQRRNSSGHSRTSVTFGNTSNESSTEDKVFQQTTFSPSSSSYNCSAYMEHHNETKGNQSYNSSQRTTRSWSENGGFTREDINASDCMTTHSLEKQKVTLVHGSSASNTDSSAPVYIVEISDIIWGSFINISCLNAVHTNINSKVNELLREFGKEIGGLMCKDAPDASLELASGNIRFKGTRMQAKIFMKFSISFSTSGEASASSCGREFQTYAVQHLPQKFEKTKSEVLASECKFLNYTRQSFNIINSDWSCQSGFLLNESIFQCVHDALNQASTSDITTATVTSMHPAPVLTVPSLSLLFAGTFTPSNTEIIIDEDCLKEYKVAFIKVLTSLEQSVQSGVFKDIFTSIEKDINVTLSNKKVIAEFKVNLIPLQDSVDSISMYKNANFTSLQLREPSQRILYIPGSKMPSTACPMLTLSAHGLRTEVAKFHLYCPYGYLINEANFKCMNENLPLYTTSIMIAVNGSSKELDCRNAIQQSAQQLRANVYSDIHLGLSLGIICNTSKDILFLKRHEEISVKEYWGNISIPMTLINLQGGMSDTVDCAVEMYKYLKSVLAQPITSMMNNVTNICKNNITLPQTFRVPYRHWTCFEQRVYNPSTHKCDIVTTQAPTTQSVDGILLKRHKRSVTYFELRPKWNATLPTCIDIEPPMFDSCPVTPIEIIIGQFGPPASLPLPNVTDNSGVRPSITFTPDICPPYRFTKNSTIVMTATDDAGNSAKCTFNVIIIDEIPPVITCPTHLVAIFPEISNGSPQITFNNTGVAAFDNSGFVNVVYDPPEGTVVKTTDIILVTASAIDGNLNVANCSYFVKVENQECSERSLPHPEGGSKTCIFVENQNKDKELSCAVFCPRGKGFAVQPPKQYTCVEQWLPHKRVPQCVESQLPDFEMRLSFQLPYQGNTTMDCLQEMLNVLLESVRPRIFSACLNTTKDLDLSEIHNVGTFNKASETVMKAKLKIVIKLGFHSLAVAAMADQCRRAVLKSLDFNNTVHRSCGQIKLTSPVANDLRNSCPEGFSLISSQCYECPPGTYLTKLTCKECPRESSRNKSEIANCTEFDCSQGYTDPECLECPVGTYQDSPGSKQCFPCMSGYSTIDVGATDEKECIAECKENQFSFTGLVPCLPCPLGTHQRKTGSKSCEICEFDTDGISQFSYCKKLCAPGEYSSAGTAPCSLCPLNYYSQNTGSTTCTACPDNKMTKRIGCVTQDQCEGIEYIYCTVKNKIT